MHHINTTRGWRPLHKRHHDLAKSWEAEGWNVEDKVKTLSASDYWVSEYIDGYSEVVTRLLNSARRRARRLSIEFDIEFRDIEIPKVCPLRRVPFKVGIGQSVDDSPTLDRKDPRLGYIKGNVWVISHKANRLKSNFTPMELKMFCEAALEQDWITWTNEEEAALQKQQTELKRRLNDSQKPRWWALYGNSTLK
ncbi:MAG: hypothetical protein QM576_11595 [Rhodopseudomonas sp.]|uniref:hypothetical protein n=1 Tax=Rhodopseudomonas sp. TaxID=1078 RepID=UPI0039E30683